MRKENNWRKVKSAIKNYILVSVVLIAFMCAICAMASIMETKIKEVIVLILSVVMLRIFGIANF